MRALPIRRRDATLTLGAALVLILACASSGIGGGSFDGMLALEYTFGTDPVAGRRGAPNQFLFPKNNPTLTPPMMGKVGLWSKTDSSVEFKDFQLMGRQ